MRVLSLFSGIGAFDLGVERAGWHVVGQVEIDPFCQRVLAKHWPDVPRWADVRAVQADDVVARCGAIDCIIGGFPCQPWSVAGKGLGADDPRHLWPEYARLIRDLRPRWIIGENVPGLRGRGADLVLGDLEALGYTCWPLVVGADDIGASHRRKRVWIVAHCNSEREQRGGDAGRGWPEFADGGATMVHATGIGRGERRTKPAWEQRRSDTIQRCADVANTSSAGLPRRRELPGGAKSCESTAASSSADMGDTDRLWQPQPQGSQPDQWRWPSNPGQEQHKWEEPRTLESPLGGATDGTARRLARWRRAALKAIGNAVVPQVAETIARGINEVAERPRARGR